MKCQATQVCRWGQAVAFALVRVGEVDDAGGGEPEGWVGDIFLFDQNEFEVSPSHPEHFGPHPVDVAVAVGRGGGAGEPVELVDPVNDAVVGGRHVGGGQYCGESVGDVHDVIAADALTYVSGPAGDAWRAQVAVGAGEVGAFPITGRAPPKQQVVGAVVAGEHHQCVIGETKVVEQIEQGAEIGVELQQARPITLLGLAFDSSRGMTGKCNREWLK